MKVNIYGLGYVGSVSAACMADHGHQVLGIDIDRGKVDCINEGISPVVEPGLRELIHRVTKAGTLRATIDQIADADVSLVCVGTPGRDNGSICLDYISGVAEQLGEYLRLRPSYHVVNIRSTVLPGTVETLIIPILERKSGKKAGCDFGVCMNPEFLREGTSIYDYHNPPLTIIGEIDSQSGAVVEALYTGIAAPLIRTNLRMAEMIKYAGNAFHALKITFANEIGNICKRLGIDGTNAMEIFCRDQKLNVSSSYLQPGFAFGGSCLPKDLRALLYKAKELDLDVPVLGSIMASNENQMDEAYNLIKKTGKKKIAVLGLSFKPGTDDLRESPIAELVETLIGKGHEVSIYDQEVSPGRLSGSNKAYIDRTIPHISCLMKNSVEEALEGSEVVVIAKRSLEFEKTLGILGNGKIIVDLVRALPRQTDLDGHYEGICW